MTPDELKSIPKGQFVVMKTGTHPMRTRLRLFLEWGITFGEPYLLPERAARAVAYADRRELEEAVGGKPGRETRAETAAASPRQRVRRPRKLADGLKQGAELRADGGN